MNTLVEACAPLAQLDYMPALSSHSLRRGMATRNGIESGFLMQLSRKYKNGFAAINNLEIENCRLKLHRSVEKKALTAKILI